MTATNCPSCGRELEVEDAYRDWTVRCPHCGREFVPREAEAREPPRRNERRRDEEEDRYDEDEPVGDFAPEPDREDAYALVAGPGMWLEICGWGSAFLVVGVCALLFGLGLVEQNNARNARNDEGAVILFLISGCVAVFGLPYFVLMGIGGRHLRNLSSRGWAMTGAILGVAAFSLIGLFGVAHTAIGVWALVAMEKPQVRRAFGLPPRPGTRRRRQRRRDE